MRAAALLGATLLALVVFQSRSHAEPDSHSSGVITEIVGESGDAGPSPRLVVMDGDGAHASLRRNWVMAASISPDRRSVAYASRTSPTEIWVLATDGRGGGRRLVRNAGTPDWSPKGDEIAFARGSDVFVESLDGSAPRRVVRNAAMPDWSPDAKKLAVVRGEDIWVVALAGAARRVIRNGYFPHWSPDGRSIAFTRDTHVESFVFVAHADGSTLRRVAGGSAAVWSPDGRELAYCQFRSIARIRPDGTDERVVYRGEPACQSLDWR